MCGCLYNKKLKIYCKSILFLKRKSVILVYIQSSIATRHSTSVQACSASTTSSMISSPPKHIHYIYYPFSNFLLSKISSNWLSITGQEYDLANDKIYNELHRIFFMRNFIVLGFCLKYILKRQPFFSFL